MGQICLSVPHTHVRFWLSDPVFHVLCDTLVVKDVRSRNLGFNNFQNGRRQFRAASSLHIIAVSQKKEPIISVRYRWTYVPHLCAAVWHHAAHRLTPGTDLSIRTSPSCHVHITSDGDGRSFLSAVFAADICILRVTVVFLNMNNSYFSADNGFQ